MGIIRNWFTLVDLFETTRVKGLAKMDCIADEAAIITKELLYMELTNRLWVIKKVVENDVVSGCGIYVWSQSDIYRD